MSVNEQLQDIQRTLGKHTGLLSGVKDRLDQTRDNTAKLFDQGKEFGERVAKVEERVNGFERQASKRGVIGGSITGAIVIGIRMGWEWLNGR